MDWHRQKSLVMEWTKYGDVIEKQSLGDHWLGKMTMEQSQETTEAGLDCTNPRCHGETEQQL
eukprot:6703408-Ditylum_brightwellii.AAC.1